MSTILLWCLHHECRKGVIVKRGVIPPICPSCAGDGFWSTECPWPLRKWDLSHNDIEFLHSIRISPGEPSGSLRLT